MSRQVLILNVTRMGDLVQTVPLVARLHQEWPGVAVDLVVDDSFVPMASMLPGVRRIHSYDFRNLITESRAMVRDVVRLYQDVAAWGKPLAATGYDRVVNLTFNRRSGLLAAYVGAPDIRGIATAPDGSPVVRNPWMAYFTDLHHYRRFNRFNLVDLYALGGSGAGVCTPLSLGVSRDATDWAERVLTADASVPVWIAVQVGASEAIKVWRPEYFGRTMAAISRARPVGFVLIGTTQESDSVKQAIAAYRQSGGSAPLRDMVGRTDLQQLAALLARCRLMLTNDTGPMHVAVAAGTPVVDLSVGHVDFHETGPYGPGHWVVQPDLGCAPCGFDQVCAHHACKDRIVIEDIAVLSMHAMGAGPFPFHATGVRIYESEIDKDGLASYRLQAGRQDPLENWYGVFWRHFWYQALSGQQSRVAGPAGPAPDWEDQRRLFERLYPLLERLVQAAEEQVRLTRRRSLPIAALQTAQARLAKDRQEALALARDSRAFWPLAVACLREASNGEAQTVPHMADEQRRAYHLWKARSIEVARLLCLTRMSERSAAVGLHWPLPATRCQRAVRL